MPDTAIRVEGLGKRYRIGGLERYWALREGLSDFLSGLVRWGAQRTARAESSDAHLWALKEVSFEISRGEVVGVIGPNGAGKTTLLKILSRITSPTEGSAAIHGRVGSLLEVGTGFHPELSGRDNIFLSGAILGMRRTEIARKFDEIVSFSGVEKFIDLPIKRYSSGMHVRLAFAVAAHLEPEILLVDEVLAVGDMAFQEKCLGKVGEVVSAGRTVLLVSHNMAAIRRFCRRALLIAGGRLVAEGAPDQVVQEYLLNGSNSDGGRVCLESRSDRGGNGMVRLTGFEARPADGRGSELRTGASADFIIAYRSFQPDALKVLTVILTVSDELGDNLFTCMTSITPLREFRDLKPAGTVRCRIGCLPLIPGRYMVSLTLKTGTVGGAITDSISGAASFRVVDGGESGLAHLPPWNGGKVVVAHEWEREEALCS